MEIVFISDYVCPYCLVAKEALRQALMESGTEASIRWQPYELTPEPRERVDTYHDEKRRAGYQVLVEPCRRLGLDMKLPPRVIPRPYTRLAFEGWYYACDHGRGEEYNDQVYKAYFIQEQDIGNVETLAEIAAGVGLDKEDFTEALLRGTYSDQEKQAVEYARNVLKPQGVPTLYIDGQEVELQEYTKEELLRVLQKKTEPMGGSFMRCGEDGCHM